MFSVLSSVAYWPPTRPSCQKKKCTCVNNRCIQSRMSGDNLDCRRFELSGHKTIIYSVHRKFESVGEKMLEWEPCPSRGWAPRPPVEQPIRTGKKYCYSQKNGGQYVAVLFSLQLTFCTIILTIRNPLEPFRIKWKFTKLFCLDVAQGHMKGAPNETRTHPFRIKWEVYFSKELCPLVFIELNMFQHAYVYV